MEKYWIYHCGTEDSFEGLSIFSCGYWVLKFPKIWFAVTRIPVSCLQLKDEKKKKRTRLRALSRNQVKHGNLHLDLHPWIKSKTLSGGFSVVYHFLEVSNNFDFIFFLCVFFWKAWIISLPEVGLGRWTGLVLFKPSMQLTIFIILALCRNQPSSFKQLWVKSIQRCVPVPAYHPKMHWAGIMLKIEAVLQCILLIMSCNLI